MTTPQEGDILLVCQPDGWHSALILNSSGDLVEPSGPGHLSKYQGLSVLLASPSAIAAALHS